MWPLILGILLFVYLMIGMILVIYFDLPRDWKFYHKIGVFLFWLPLVIFILLSLKSRGGWI